GGRKEGNEPRGPVPEGINPPGPPEIALPLRDWPEDQQESKSDRVVCPPRQLRIPGTEAPADQTPPPAPPRFGKGPGVAFSHGPPFGAGPPPGIRPAGCGGAVEALIASTMAACSRSSGN